ncbi:MAG: methyltransferase domain-containing protein [Clostridiales bacterium]|nr:methyltransferase domain-containing protein [Clostridiales bacterium]
MVNKTRDWDAEYLAVQNEKPVYDLCLDKYGDTLELSRCRPILDLGCGKGNDSLYLTERGFRVVSCDKSAAAVAAVKKHLPEAQGLAFDMLEGLPFEDGSFQVVIADLCLHYFSWDNTVRAVRDIHRILKTDGVLLCRVNSTKDYNHGAGQGARLEDNYFYVKGNTKRFFNQKDAEALFQGWEMLLVRECRLDRFEQPKMLWEIAVRKTGE